MFEESLEGFISRWRPFATPVRIFARVEGDPLLEVGVAGAIIQVLERTGPYLAPPGRAVAIINPTADTVEAVEAQRKGIEATGIGCAKVTGQVIGREDPFLLVDAGAPLVVGVHGDIPSGVSQGSWVGFEVVPPIHGFVLRSPASPAVRPADGEGP